MGVFSERMGDAVDGIGMVILKIMEGSRNPRRRERGVHQ